MRTAIPALLGFLCALPAWGAQSARDFKVEVLGVKVQKTGYSGDDKLYAFNQNIPGTDVVLLVTSARPGLLKPDTKKCTIRKMTDDKGTDLLKKVKSSSGFTRDPGFWPFPKVSSDSKACVLQIQSPGVPKKGARAILVEAELEMMIGQGEVVQKAPRVTIQKGASFKAGPLAFKIEDIQKPTFGDGQQEIHLKMPPDVEKIVKIRFLDASGAEIESKKSGHMSFGRNITHHFELKKAMTAGSIEVVVWKELKKIKVPVKLTVSLGL